MRRFIAPSSPTAAALMPRARIPDVGDLLFFADPSGIVAGAMQYDRTSR